MILDADRVEDLGVATPHTRGDDPEQKHQQLIEGATPHTRGDDPYALDIAKAVVAYSPHPWG